MRNYTYKKLVLIVIGVLLLTCLAACGTSNDDPIYGKWELYGIIEQGTDYQNSFKEDDIITGKEYWQDFGTAVPENTITISENGIEEFADVPGTEIKSFEKKSDNLWVQTMEVTELAGEEKLQKPMDIQYLLNIKEGKYLLVEERDEYDSVNVNVYIKK